MVKAIESMFGGAKSPAETPTETINNTTAAPAPAPPAQSPIGSPNTFPTAVNSSGPSFLSVAASIPRSNQTGKTLLGQ